MRAPVSGGVDETLWRAHVRMGTWFSLVTCAAELLYCVLTPQGPHRVLLAAIAIAAAIGTLPLFVLPLRPILHHPRGMLFFYAWTVALCALLTVGLVLDGGITSPLVVLFFLPLTYAALAYPLEGVAVAGAGVAAGLLTATAAEPVEVGHLVMVLIGFAILTGMCALQARGLRAAHARQRLLLARQIEAARHDHLTDCLTHRAFHDDAAALRDGADRSALSLIVLDLDEFRAVNEGHGHPVGDALLSQVGAAVRAVAREGDLAGRVGGDEFAVLLPATGAQDALRLGEDLQRALRALSDPLAITASLGVATVADPTELSALFEQADEARYTAKHRGRDRLAVFSADTDQVLARSQLSGAERTLHRRVRALLAPGAITAVFQPICSLDDGRILGYEALSRIPSSHLGPDRWLDLAGGVGLRPELEAAMWQAALRVGPPPGGASLFLNASPEVLLTGVLDDTRAQLATLGAVIEVSEEHAVSDYAPLLRVLDAWKALGITTAVDDMGAGRANLRHVLRLTPRYLKLDRSIVADIQHHPEQQVLVTTLLRFAESLGSELIAEGMEVEEEASTLRALGVTWGQGYLLARPGPPWPARTRRAEAALTTR